MFAVRINKQGVRRIHNVYGFEANHNQLVETALFPAQAAEKASALALQATEPCIEALIPDELFANLFERVRVAIRAVGGRKLFATLLRPSSPAPSVTFPHRVFSLKRCVSCEVSTGTCRSPALRIERKDAGCADGKPKLSVDDGLFELEDSRVIGFSGITKGIATHRLVPYAGEGHDDKRAPEHLPREHTSLLGFLGKDSPGLL